MVVLNYWEHLQMSEYHDITAFMQHVNDVIRDLKVVNLNQPLEVIVHRILNHVLKYFEKLVRYIENKKTYHHWKSYGINLTWKKLMKYSRNLKNQLMRFFLWRFKTSITTDFIGGLHNNKVKIKAQYMAFKLLVTMIKLLHKVLTSFGNAKKKNKLWIYIVYPPIWSFMRAISTIIQLLAIQVIFPPYYQYTTIIELNLQKKLQSSISNWPTK